MLVIRRPACMSGSQIEGERPSRSFQIESFGTERPGGVQRSTTKRSNGGETRSDKMLALFFVVSLLLLLLLLLLDLIAAAVLFGNFVGFVQSISIFPGPFPSFSRGTNPRGTNFFACTSVFVVVCASAKIAPG